MSFRSQAFVVFFWCLGAGLGFCSDLPKTVEIGQTIPAGQWTDYQGREWKSSEFSDKKATVYVSLGTQCPLAKIYSTRIVELEKKFRDQSVAFVALDANVQDSLSEMAAHAKKFGIEFPFVKDPDQRWADLLGITRTPEACVVDSAGKLTYRGRIDDQYGIGYAKEKPTFRNLLDAIEKTITGKEIAEPITQAPGCLLGRGKSSRKNSQGAESVTYAEHVSRILQNRCVNCHRADEIGPMDLSNYDDASAWADMILEVVNEGRMPPWHASPEHGHFSNDRRLSQKEIDLLNQWVQQGTPRGNAEQDPAPKSFTAGWQLPREPDLVIPMSDKPFSVPARGEVRYQYFTADPKLTEDKWVNGMEIVAGNRAIVHHILVFVRDKNNSKGQGVEGQRGFLTGYVPGTRVEMMPDGMAKRIPANSELIFQIHYTPNGTAQTDLSKVAFWYADPKAITHEVQTTSSVQTQFRIPPKEANYRTVAMQPEELPECELLSMSPHMHVRGKSFRYTAVYPDQKREVLLDVPQYDFNWQTEYRLTERKTMPEGTRMFCEAVFDNSEKNLNNPDPNSYVSWGDQTYEEMMIGYFHVAVPIDPSTGRAQSVIKGRPQRPTPERIFDALDADGDDRLLRSEVPKNLLPVFDRLDKNGDKVLERSELK